VLHTASAIGVTGAIATFLVLRAQGPAAGHSGYVEVRHGIDAAYRWLAVPSLVVCVLSGLLSMVVHRPYWNAVWAWLKAATTAALLGLTLRMQSVARDITSPEVLGHPAELLDSLATERKGLWMLLVVLLINVVLGIYRPRLVGPPQR